MKEKLEAALDAVKKACIICTNVRSELVSDATIQKKDKSPVTVADFGSQALILDFLSKKFPDIPAVGEEDSAELRTEVNQGVLEKIISHVNKIEPSLSKEAILSAIDFGNHEGGSTGTFWALDPIDGTKGFLRNEQYAIALGLIKDGEVILGVLGCPNLPLDLNNPEGEKGSLFYAIKGEGAFSVSLSSNEIKPISVNDINDPSIAKFCESVESGHTSHNESSKIAAELKIENPSIRMDSQCKYAAVARGDAEIYLRLPAQAGYVEKIWDHAAGAIILQEAGATISDINGKPLDFSQGKTLKNNIGVVASSRAIHKPIIEAIETVKG